MIATVALVAAASSLARAQDASATASLSETSTEVGQAVEYRIDVVGDRNAGEPKAPKVEGLNITLIGRNEVTQMNGSFGSGLKIVTTTTYTFNVEPTRAGRFVIPGQQIDSGSGAIQVAPAALTVTAGGSGAAQANPARATFIQITADKKAAYVGEAIPIEVRAYFGLDVQFQTDGNIILNGEGFTAQKFAAPRQSVQALDDAQYRVLTYRTSLAGAKTGTLSVGPAEIESIVQLPRDTKARRRSSFSNPFDDDPFFRDPFGALNATIRKQVRLRTEPLEIEMKALPSGAPADFTGAVGQFNLDADAEPRRVQAGDPVKVRLRVSGKGNFDRVNAPTLSDEQGLHAYPPSASFKGDEALGLNGTKTFEQQVVAQGGRKSLPAYHFSYFDPETAKYVSLKTAPLAVVVEGAPAATVTPTPVPPPAAAPTPAPAEKPRDILYIRTDAGTPASFAPVYERREFWIVQGALAALFLAATALTWRRAQARNEARRLSAEAQRREAELLRALQGEGTARRDFYSAAARLAQLKAAAAVGRPGAHLSAAEVCAAKRSDPQTAASVADIFNRHDELAYSGGSVAQEPVPSEERRTVLNTLETLGR